MVAPFSRRQQRPRDLRRQMIDETSAFLTWALSGKHDLPRIPTRLVDKGGFAALMSVPGARKLAARWWSKALSLLPDR